LSRSPLPASGRGAWGTAAAPQVQKLCLKVSLTAEAGAGSVPPRHSLAHIQHEQEQVRATRRASEARIVPARPAPYHLSPAAPTLARSSGSPASGQLSMASFLQRSAPQVIPGRRGLGKSRPPPSSAASLGSPGASAWSMTSVLASSEEGRSSFRDIQLAEESVQRELGLPTAGSTSPRQAVWMPLPGDYKPVGKSLRLIEEEELAMREAERRLGGSARAADRRDA
jgi:hypothetical protein